MLRNEQAYCRRKGLRGSPARLYTRKQNLSNCSDAKLKMNYKVCKELGFEKEMDLLKQEAEKRNINIEEKLTLQEIVLCDNEFNNDTEG